MHAPALFALLLFFSPQAPDTIQTLRINKLDYFETPGVNVFVFSNWYNDMFSDSKMSGIELIHHGVRTATNGDVRLSSTPEQWDPIPQFVERKVNKDTQTIEAFLKYPGYNFAYSIQARAEQEGILVSVILPISLPKVLEGKAGFNLEFLPSAYFKKSYMIDGRSGIFPLHPGGPMKKTESGTVDPQPLASGRTLVLASEDPARRVSIQSLSEDIALYDGRNKAQNGWFVVRSLLPAGKTGSVLQWHISVHGVRGWKRPPVISYTQTGYHPDQNKVAVIELDKNDQMPSVARLFRVDEYGKEM
jgi:endoglucanase